MANGVTRTIREILPVRQFDSTPTASPFQGEGDLSIQARDFFRRPPLFLEIDHMTLSVLKRFAVISSLVVVAGVAACAEDLTLVNGSWATVDRLAAAPRRRDDCRRHRL